MKNIYLQGFSQKSRTLKIVSFLVSDGGCGSRTARLRTRCERLHRSLSVKFLRNLKPRVVGSCLSIITYKNKRHPVRCLLFLWLRGLNYTAETLRVYGIYCSFGCLVNACLTVSFFELINKR